MMLTLDVRPDVVKEAIENDVDFIFAHHPAMFVPVHQIDLSNPQQKMYADILKHGITVLERIRCLTMPMAGQVTGLPKI